MNNKGDSPKEQSSPDSKPVLVAGAGKSGMAAIGLLHAMGRRCILLDENTSLDEQELKKRLPQGTEETEIFLGALPVERAGEIEYGVISPGIPVDAGLGKALQELNIPIIGEIELAWKAEKGTLLAITGTNGKTTTTSLVGEIMKKHRERVFVVGNIGEPYTLTAALTDPESVSVAEISSFQLETIQEFHPKVSAILNLTPDHLNRHHTMENYAAMKKRITMNQTEDDFCVLNAEDPYTRAMGEQGMKPQVIWFSSAKPLEDGFYLQGEEIYKACGGEARPILNIRRDMRLKGLCNVENVMAAIAMTEAAGVPMEQILEAVRKFKAVEHRIEYVATVDGVEYYNDSKATNPDAAIQGIKAMERPTVLIGGGYDKGGEFDDWIECFGSKVKALVLIGQTADRIEECAKKHGVQRILRADSFEECLSICTEEAKEGDAVLLSPACASWGMFKDFEERGRLFKEYVWKLQQGR